MMLDPVNHSTLSVEQVVFGGFMEHRVYLREDLICCMMDALCHQLLPDVDLFFGKLPNGINNFSRMYGA